jgi:hypothetical protein
MAEEIVLAPNQSKSAEVSRETLQLKVAMQVMLTARRWKSWVAEKFRDAGHTVATHTQNHPTGMHLLPIERVQQEIDEGIASVSAALGDGTAPAPFFRVPGLARAEGIEQYAALKGAQVWSADFPADDWRHVSSSRVYELAMQRLEAKGKGILLLHDIQARTVAALPAILRDLKAGGYRIVHVVPSRPDLPPTPTEPQQWRMHPDVIAARQWPVVPGFAFARSEMLPIPAMAQSGMVDGALMLLPESFARVKRLGPTAPWAMPLPTTVASTNDNSLPVPADWLYTMPEPVAGAMASQAVAIAPKKVKVVARRPSPRVHIAAPTNATTPKPPAMPFTMAPLASSPAATPASVEANATRRPIPGSMPVTPPGLHRQ